MVKRMVLTTRALAGSVQMHIDVQPGFVIKTLDTKTKKKVMRGCTITTMSSHRRSFTLNCW